ncbi:hypothetical protein F8388_002087 [Cannabis sativa]|uniref:Hydroxyproline-rich glycoprotein n=2 Tax=Cannabis sativa TaxID=3483 RepID=A0A7J6EYY9_CANSA|nr:hypothetical protein F8388_002087 [Cannabis sativa]KAF4391932.1 hypothetical protein G4B88_007507 [Cannabis sativa]
MPHRRDRSYSSPVLSPPVLIILLPILTFVFLFFAIPPVVTFTSHIFRPFTVKKSWDSLNIFLVLFAILCGIFARKNDDDSSGVTATTTENDVVLTPPTPNVSDHVRNARIGPPISVSESVSQEWFGFSDRNDNKNSINNIYDDQINRTPPPGSATLRLRRSSSSYPDLRQESVWDDNRDDQKFQFRFFDDFDIKKYRQTVSFDHRHRSRQRSKVEEDEIKEVPVDTFVVRPSTPPKSPAPPPPPPPPAAPKNHLKSRRTYRSVERREKVEKRDENGDADIEFTKTRSPPPTPLPPPPRPSPSPARIQLNQKKLERKKSNVKREITMAITSLYNQRKRKKKLRIANNNYDFATQSSPTEQLQSHHTKVPPPSPPPPPPPPPPPYSVFHNLFRKGIKSKRIHSVPPPPPPPPRPILSSLASTSRSYRTKNRSVAPPASPPPPQSEHSRRRTSGRPPLPAKSSSYCDDNMNSGCQSPLIPMPPPPPPPFKMPEFKYLVSGDYVKIRSAQSSRCGSPEQMDDADSSSTKEESESVNMINGGDGFGSVFCPSPDVDIKADTFIARLYDGWRLEKINSIKGKRKL